MRIIDEDCSGIVKKEEYYDSLQAYGINEEKNLNATRTYGQEGLLKFAMILLQQQMTPEDSYLKMDPVKKGTIQPIQFS